MVKRKKLVGLFPRIALGLIVALVLLLVPSGLSGQQVETVGVTLEVSSLVVTKGTTGEVTILGRFNSTYLGGQQLGMLQERTR